MSSNNRTRRLGRGRRRIPLERIENDVQRNVSFSKRRFGLFKKANEISTLCGVKILVVVFPPNQEKVYTFGSPSVPEVLNKYVAERENRTIETNDTEEFLRSQEEANIRNMNHRINLLEEQIQHEMNVSKALTEAAKGMPSISNLPLAELLPLKQKMETLLSTVRQMLNQRTMPVQTPAMPVMTTTQSDNDVLPSGATPF
ncbi:PREDICTED: MADS-box transcription factor 23-like [Ipomoea nil]|uniref:MADS-box transcription factor 23-like n=1 Tax=Ipomoea nil TaxID=35883 RepID=UPI0009018EE5|nr:PREDICTED: MADS-box transcription factor 23-like [Ipomoea nil]